MRFDQHIGIDYSGAKDADARLSGLRLFLATDGNPQRQTPPKPGTVNWTRRELYQRIADAVAGDQRVIVGIDHAFAFPADYMERNGIVVQAQCGRWDAFLDHCVRHWPTSTPGKTVEDYRAPERPGGGNTELRLCEKWTAGAKSVFWFDVNGSVAKSTRAGIPWLRELRRSPTTRDRIHWWPFDGFEIPDGKSVVAEVFPSIFRRRYAENGRTTDEQDAYATARWLTDMDRRELLERYFRPPLTDPEVETVRDEGWILGIM